MSNLFSPKSGVNQPNLSTNKLSLAITSVLFSSSLGLALLPGVSYAENNPKRNVDSSSIRLAEANSTQGAMVTFSIPAARLDTVLKHFAKIAGINLSYQASAVSNINSNGLDGRYTIDTGLEKLLAGSGFKVIKTANGYKLSKKTKSKVATLATAVVQADTMSDGSAQDGYISDGNTSVGVWQNRTLQETPYSINVVSNDLIKNLQATSTDQIFKMNPVVQFNRPQSQNDGPDVYMRGFDGGTSSRNGLTRDGYDHGVSMADVERIEILTGMSGFLYGGGNIGGMVNYVTKRPTEERYNSVIIGNTSGSNLYAHGDFGGRIDKKGDFGYRVNVLAQAGDTAVEHQDAERKFVSVALDWHATDSLLIQVDASTRDYHLKGRQAYWNLGGVKRPSAETLDSDKLWGQKWSYQNTQTDRLGVNIHWDISERFTFRAAYLDEKVVRHSALSFNTLESENTYKQSTKSNEKAPHTMNTESMFAFLDVDFDTGSINHKVTTGFRYSDNTQERFKDGRSQALKVDNIPLNEQRYLPEPEWDEYGTTPYFLWSWGVENYTLGDDITFNEQWSALIGVTHGKVYDKTHLAGVYQPDDTYKDDATTPSLSIVYKPHDSVSTYITYMEGMENGSTVWDDEVILQDGLTRSVMNFEAKLGLLISEQIELGAKADLGGMLLTAALFEIDKPLEYYQILNDEQAKFVQDGRQVHRGLEFTATGSLTDNFTIVGGFTLLDAQVKKQEQNPELEGNTPREVAERMVKLYGEYNVSAMPGLTINGGFSYTGDFYSNLDNKEKLTGYTLVDIGARYEFDLANNPLALRLNINNLTDKSYWANTQAVGEGRRVVLSANITF